MTIAIVSENKCFNGTQKIISHESRHLNCNMRLSVFLPLQAEREPRPVIFWLSGLTCTEENFTSKAGAQRYAANHGLIIIAPDTSPRGASVPDDEAYDFGQGAGFYLNAVEDPWSKNFRMYDYITDELPSLIFQNFPAREQALGIMGHSMGGHGAITIALKNSNMFRSVSAFSPIVAPTQCPWGEKAFRGYLGSDRSIWKDYDATCLVEEGYNFDGSILIDQGDADQFLEEQLKPELFQQACDSNHQSVLIRMHSGYDHSYYFIASFMEDHIAHHADALLKS